MLMRYLLSIETFPAPAIQAATEAMIGMIGMIDKCAEIGHS
jgi:hypothetical protein